MAADANCLEVEALKKYEYIQYVIPDVNSIPRGKIVMGKFKEKVAREGFEIGNAICMAGPNTEIPLSVCDILGKHMPNEEMRPCLDTLTPWPWVGKEGRRVGNVLCDLCMHDGTSDLTSPRQLMKAQMDALREKHGLVFKSAFEYEFGVYKEGSMETLGGDNVWCWDVRIWGEHHDLFCDLTDLLGVMGVEVSSLMPEFTPGQWEITTEPQEGVRGGDVAFYVKNAVKGFFKTRGYHATFMSAKPSAETFGAGLHLNHSLWTVGGASAMLDQGKDDRMSESAKHWLAGILHHAPALTALCCPTLNCYRRLFNLGAPGKVTWGLDDRNAMVRVHTARDNVFLENRLPSGACSPYLAIAATVAAGLDGLDRKLQCPPPNTEVQKPGELPRTTVKAGESPNALEQPGEVAKTLAEALDALEKDGQLRGMLGERFVDCYVKAKREYEVRRYENAELHTEEKQLEFERNMYMKNL
ncbi:glutamine synthetase-like [Littorina saxatilis]|uniref:glutamine synthetase-like n=1 Tax=Littorina saxatilis TaxID=31220 RepID=UPI0038B50A47